MNGKGRSKTMSEKEKFQRKLQIRFEAYRNLGVEKIGGKNTTVNNPQINELCRLIEKNIEQADNARSLVYFQPIAVGTGRMSRFKRLMKRAVRKIHFKLFGWMLMPLIDQQNIYNGKVLNAINELKDMMILQEMERETE